MAKPKHSNLIIATAVSLFVGACTQVSGLSPNTTSIETQGQSRATPPSDTQSATQQKSFNRFPDIPVPSGADMDMARTIVFGGGESWYGQLGLDARHDPNAMFDFYKQELPGFNWAVITSVRAPVSVLTYERQNRVLSIQLEKGTLGGTKVTLTISPRGRLQTGQRTPAPMTPTMAPTLAPPMN